MTTSNAPFRVRDWLDGRLPADWFSDLTVTVDREEITIVGTIAAPESEGPDAEVLTPGALKAATRAAPVAVHGSWSAGGAVRAGAASKGTLRFADKRISFETDQGETTFDTPVNKVRMAAVPGFWRPQLDLDIGDITHTIRFFPLWDLGATVVGPVVAGEWYAQLRYLGAK